MNRQEFSSKLFLFGLFVLIVSLPLSVFGMSVSQIIIACAWLLGGTIFTKFKTTFSNPVVWVLTGLYVIHLIGAVYTTDVNYLMRDLRIKMPLLFLPIIFSTAPVLTTEDFKKLMTAFVLAVFISTIISMGVLYDILPHKNPITDIRSISVFISHIRLSLLICLAIFTCVGFLNTDTNRKTKVVLTFLVAWFLVFMYILEAMTGIIILFLTSAVTAFLFLKGKKWKAIKIIVAVVIILIPLAGIRYVKKEAARILKPVNIDYEMLDKVTANGNRYLHFADRHDQENGNLVWIYVCESEMEMAWNNRSNLFYSGKDLMGHDLKYTLIRFLASKGLKKDSAGVFALSDSEIQSIEKSIPNVEYQKMGSLKIRLHKTIMEYYDYKLGKNPTGSSMLQRLEFWKAGTNIFLQNFFTGVGTGDVQQAFDKEYERINSPLSEEKRFRAHNQYLTFALTFGVFGLLYFVFYLLFPYFRMKKRNNFFYSCFIIVAALSMFTEDTLETQAGVTFFIFFNCFFLFLQPQDSPSHSRP